MPYAPGARSASSTRATRVARIAAAPDGAVTARAVISKHSATKPPLPGFGHDLPILRGFALLARCAGLVGHLHEEQQTPAMIDMWHAVERAVPYEP